MQNHEPVEVIVVILDDFDQFGPQGRLHVRGVDRRVKLVRGNAVVEPFQFRHVLLKLVEVKCLQGTGFRIFNHTDCTSSVDE